MGPRVIALYLPQFHPVDINDRVRGKGFTEWRNVVTSKPLFYKHYQPRIPADLGFYDLRLKETRNLQAEYAKKFGIEGFCYWHYWFGNGKTVLERPLNDVIDCNEPEFPLCVGRAIHDWKTNTWERDVRKRNNNFIFKQEFFGDCDYIKHFEYLLKVFKDERYIKVDGKLLFLIYGADKIPDLKHFLSLWNELAVKQGFKGFHFVAVVETLAKIDLFNISDLRGTIRKNLDWYFSNGFNAVNTVNQKYAEFMYNGKIVKALKATLRKINSNIFLEKYNYKKIMENFYTQLEREEYIYPQLLAGWDRSPRSGSKAIIYYDDVPENFRFAVKKCFELIKSKESEHQIVILNSWNEWGEGAFVEPDLKYGLGKLEVLSEEINAFKKDC